MSEEITKTEQTQETVGETQETTEEIKEETKEETKEVSDEESKKSAIGKIGDMVKNFVSGKSTDGDEETGDLIPDDFTNAALDAGWDEKTIMSWAGGLEKDANGEWVKTHEPYSNEELLEMIPTLKGEDSVETEQTSNKTETKSETKETKVEDSQEDEKTQKLLDRIDALEERQGKADKQTEQQKSSELDKRASQIFDETSKEFKVFGKTKTLPVFPAGPNKGQLIPTSPAMKARIEVWELAHDLHKKAGMDFDNAMSVSLNAYKGKNLAKDVERNLIKDLKSREKKLSGKHTTHESVSTELSGPAVVQEMLRRAGKE